MKKIFLLLICCFCFLGLACCNFSFISNNNENKDDKPEEIVKPEEEKNDYGIEVTEDKEKITNYLMAILENNAGKIIDDTDYMMISCDADVTDMSEQVYVKANCLGNIAVGKKNTSTESMLESIKGLEASAKFMFSGNITVGTEQIDINSSSINIYLEDGKVYCKINVDDNIISMVGEELAAINNNTILIDLESLLSMIPLEEIEEYAKTIENNNQSAQGYFEENKEEIKEALKEAVEKCNVVIKEVKGNKVTISADLTNMISEYSTNSKLLLECALDVKDVIIESAKIDYLIDEELIKGSVKFNLNAINGGSVEKISSADKEKAIDISSFIEPEPIENNYIFASASQMIEFAKTKVKETKTYANSSSTKVPNFSVPSGGYDGSKVEITFYHTMGSNLSDVLNDYIKEFNKIYPNITIKSIQIGGYDDVRNQIATELTVGVSPNIAYCYSDHVALYNLTGSVVQLDNLINSYESNGNGGRLGLTAEEKADFIEAFYNEGRQFGDGLQYTIPFSKSTEVMYYDKTFFTRNNIPVPDHWFSEGPNDITSMEAVCEMLKAIDPNCIPFGYDSEANFFITMCEQLGIGVVDEKGNLLLNNAYTKGLLLKLNEWYQKGYFTTQSLYGAYTSSLFVNRETVMPRSYMCIASSAGSTHHRPSQENGEYPFEVGIASIPQMNENNKNVIIQGPSVCIFKKDNPQEVIASWLFVKYLTTSSEFQSEFSMASGYVPVLKSVINNRIYSDFLVKADGYDYIAAQSAKVCLEQTDSYFTMPGFSNMVDLRDFAKRLICYGLTYQSSSDIKGYIESLLSGIPFTDYSISDDNNSSIEAMSYSDFMNAELKSDVTIFGFVQAKQEWWQREGVGLASIYLADNDGGYFVYNMRCTKERYDKLFIGKPILVSGKKTQYAGLVEISDAEFIPVVMDYAYVASPTELTAFEFGMFGHDYMNQLISLKGLKVVDFDDEGHAFGYKWNGTGERGDDIYFKVQLGETIYIFVIESYLCNKDSEVYKMAENLKVGDVINIEAFLYWYNGPQPQVTKITK